MPMPGVGWEGEGQEAWSREGGTLAFSVPKLPGFLSFRKEPLPCPPNLPFPDGEPSQGSRLHSWSRAWVCPPLVVHTT